MFVFFFLGQSTHSKTTVCAYKIQPPGTLFKLLREQKPNAWSRIRFMQQNFEHNYKQLTCQLRILFSPTQIPIQWLLALRITLTLFFKMFPEDGSRIAERTRYQTQSRRLVVFEEVNFTTLPRLFCCCVTHLSAKQSFSNVDRSWIGARCEESMPLNTQI